MKRSQIKSTPMLPNMRQCMGFMRSCPEDVKAFREENGDDKVIQMWETMHDLEKLQDLWDKYTDEIAKDLKNIPAGILKWFENMQKMGAAYYQIMLERYGAAA